MMFLTKDDVSRSSILITGEMMVPFAKTPLLRSWSQVVMCLWRLRNISSRSYWFLVVQKGKKVTALGVENGNVQSLVSTLD